jgi:predicted nucleic acid-binding protein
VSSTASADAWVVDASVAVKWFLPVEREPDGELARSSIGRLAMRTTTLAVHEVGNVLTIHSGWSAEKIAAALALLTEICGDPLELNPQDHRTVADLALAHDLTFYDASYVAIARRTGRRLLSADRDLIAPGLAVGLGSALQ